MTTAAQIKRNVQQYRAEEMQIVEALRTSIAPVWIDAYGSIESRDANGITFDMFIAAVLDALPMGKGKVD